jgi:nucleotide-binding universal stress UspA family protein
MKARKLTPQAMKKLLIPVDFSETSEAAIEFGIQLAQKCSYHVMLLHSVDLVHTYESMYMDVPHVQSFTQQVINDMEVRLENLYRQTHREGMVMTKHLTTGTLIQDIKKIVDEYHVDLIVMGTNGASGLKEFFVGSNTEKVVRLVNCPVISIPSHADVRSIRKILVPIDLSEIRPSFLMQVSHFQQLFSAAMEFVWVKTPHDIENIDLITDEVNNLLSEYEVASSSFTVIKDVFTQDGILNYAMLTDADMIAMATHARRGIAHWFSGSLTEDVVNHAHIPLWSLKIDETEKTLNLESFQSIHEVH